MKTEINGRDNRLVSYWPLDENNADEILYLLRQLNNLSIGAKFGGLPHAPTIEVDRNGHHIVFKQGELLVVHNQRQLAVLEREVVASMRLVLQEDELELATAEV